MGNSKTSKTENQQAYINPNPVKLNFTARDGWQSNHGTRVPADEMNQAYANVGNYGIDSVQAMGGTFTDLPTKYNRQPFELMNSVGGHFKDQGIKEITALWRGECGTSYSRQPADVLEANVGKHLDAGVNVFQNFHAMNDINMMSSIPAMVKEKAAERVVEAKVKLALVIQENPNTLERKDKILEEYKSFVREGIECGHEDIYIKNANGVITSPEFMTDIIQMLKQELPEQKIDLHMHNTYGHAPEIYLAAIKAGVDSIDVLPDALSEGTAQMGMSSLLHYIEHSGDDAIKARAPVGYNMEAMKQDEAQQYYTRAKYSATEMVFNAENLNVAEAAGSAGGAISALKSIDGLIPNLSAALNVDEWCDIQKAVYEQKEANRASLGYPTNVTPHELMQDMQAAIDVMVVARGGKAFDQLSAGTIEYLSGQLGRVSSTTDPEIQNRAIKKAIVTMDDDLQAMSSDASGYDAKKSMLNDLQKADESYISGNNEKAIEYPITLPSVYDLESGLDIARKKLDNKAIEPTDDEVLIAAISGETGVKFVMEEIEPLKEPFMPRAVQDGQELHSIAPSIYKIGYIAVELTKVKSGFYGDINGQDERVQILQTQINDEVAHVQDQLKSDGVPSFIARKANNYITQFSNQKGADIVNIPRIDLNEFSSVITINEKLASKSTAANSIVTAWIEKTGNSNNLAPSVEQEEEHEFSELQPDFE
ncbi:MAG: hypothetical protein COB36_00060 [Alphaproteobacteria bacterium]|nr:MAG: hypothetical protein COB36_00060 [Alphaproteobacteria bacterium]